MKVPVVLFGAWLVSVLPLTGGPRLTMRITPAVALAPANLIVRAMVEANPANRGLVIVADSPNFYRGTEIQLQGEEAPRTSVFEFRGLPGGTYDVSAALIDTSGRRLTVHRQISVVGDERESRPKF
jgi:hypothetical protein